MPNKLYIKEIHHLHTEWTSMLDLIRDEIQSFENRLEEVAKANTGKEVLVQVEHFQNQFIRQKELLDELRHDIHDDELRIAENVNANNVASEHRKMEENIVLSYSMHTFRKTFNEIRSDFLIFLAKKI